MAARASGRSAAWIFAPLLAATACPEVPVREEGQGPRCAVLMTCFFDEEAGAIGDDRFALLRAQEDLFEGAYGPEGSCWRDLSDDALEKDLAADCESRCARAFVELCRDTGADCEGACADALGDGSS